MSLKLNLCLKKHGIKLRILEWILRWISSTDHYKSQLESSEIQKNFQVILFCLYFYIELFYSIVLNLHVYVFGFILEKEFFFNDQIVY